MNNTLKCFDINKEFFDHVTKSTKFCKSVGVINLWRHFGSMLTACAYYHSQNEREEIRVLKLNGRKKICRFFVNNIKFQIQTNTLEIDIILRRLNFVYL